MRRARPACTFRSGTGCGRPRARPSRSSPDSTPRSRPPSPTPPRKGASETSAWSFRRANSRRRRRSMPTTRRRSISGGRSSGRPTSRRSNAGPRRTFHKARYANARPPITQTGPCSQLPLAVILAPRARPRHNGFVVHAWLHRAGCRAVRTARSWRGIVPFTHLAREGRMTFTIGRRALLATLGGAAAIWPLAARAQQQSKVYRIGALFVGNADVESLRTELREALRKSGYVEGQNLLFEFRSAEEELDRLPRLAAELVALKVDVIVAIYTPCALAAQQATHEIPIVIVSGNPIETGLVPSLSRPGGNITGVSLIAA